MGPESHGAKSKFIQWSDSEEEDWYYFATVLHMLKDNANAQLY